MIAAIRAKLTAAEAEIERLRKCVGDEFDAIATDKVLCDVEQRMDAQYRNGFRSGYAAGLADDETRLRLVTESRSPTSHQEPAQPGE